MPNLDPNQNSLNQQTPLKKPYLKGKKRKFLLIFIILIVGGILAYITTKNQTYLNNIFNRGDEKKDIVDPNNNELTGDVINNIKEITLEDIKEASDSTGVNPLESPSLSDTETQEKIYKEIGNSDPQNYTIGYSEYGIGETSIDIKQGDSVTWVNNSPNQMNIVGEGWKSAVPREPGDQFTYTFIFLGSYKYKINDTTEAQVNVIR